MKGISKDTGLGKRYWGKRKKRIKVCVRSIQNYLTPDEVHTPFIPKYTCRHSKTGSDIKYFFTL